MWERKEQQKKKAKKKKTMSKYVRFLVILLINARRQALAQALEGLDAFEADYMATTHHMQALDEGSVAHFDDAPHRGHKWYDDLVLGKDSSSTVNEEQTSSISSSESGEADSGGGSSDASSMDTSEKRMRSRWYRECTPCPEDMLKQYRNLGIRWICGMYQRARRTFKSECMMRYRNCQDGTMFVKLYDHKCKNDSRHGKHWFYVYKI